MPKVLHFIPSIGGGGAENSLRSLARGMAQRGEWQSVIVVANVHPHETFAEELRSLGVIVHDLKQAALLKPAVWLAVRSFILKEKPDVIQTWMHHADIIGAVAAYSAGYRKVLWGVRATEVHRNPGDSALKTALFHSALGWTAKLLPQRILSNSQVAQAIHEQMGYPRQKFQVIPNGVDAQRFSPSSELRQQVRRELSIADEAPLVGFVGRFHPVKDLPLFFRTAALVQAECPQLHLLLCGGTVEELHPEALAAYECLPAREQVRFVPFGASTQRYYPAMDAFSLTSTSEAFPNVVLEAMSSALPCATTAAGDCASILAELCPVVPTGDATALAQAWLKLLRLSPAQRIDLGMKCRERVLQRYTPERMIAAFQQAYASLL